MARYMVYFSTTASKGVEVEAESPDEALNRAFDAFDYPNVNISNSFDLGDWDVADPDIDVEEM